jgi:hypothetical protein
MIVKLQIGDWVLGVGCWVLGAGLKRRMFTEKNFDANRCEIESSK